MEPTADDSCLPQNHQLFTLPSGTTAHQWLCEVPRAILLLQHGFAEYAERYVWSHSRLIPKLNARRFEVWGLDFWGHGASPGDRGIVNVQLAVEDHLQMRQQAAARNLPVFLFGHSLGGLVTAASALREPSPRFDGVILSSPALPTAMPAPVEYAVGFLARLLPSLRVPQPKAPSEELCRDAEQLHLAKTDGAIFKGQISFLVAATALREARLMWARLGQWRNPTLVLHGTADSWTDFRQSRRLVQEIPSVDKTLRLVEDGYHELLNDGNGESLVQLILDWLERRADSD